MAELLPSYLDTADLNTDDQHTRSRKRPPVLSDIMDWVQCFGMYIAIVSRHKPKRVADLLGYQRIIMGASLDCRERKWLTYDCCFHLKASASNLKQWSTIDITIWNTTFPERAIRGHQPQGPPHYYQPNSNPHQRSTRQNQPLPTRQPICLDWNDSPNGCSRPSCRYAHLSYRCVHNPRVTDRNHKASQCTVDVSRWKEALSDHTNKPLTDFFLSGVTQGFRIGFKQQLHPLKSAKWNLCCALQQPRHSGEVPG